MRSSNPTSPSSPTGFDFLDTAAISPVYANDASNQEPGVRATSMMLRHGSAPPPPPTDTESNRSRATENEGILSMHSSGESCRTPTTLHGDFEHSIYSHSGLKNEWSDHGSGKPVGRQQSGRQSRRRLSNLSDATTLVSRSSCRSHTASPTKNWKRTQKEESPSQVRTTSLRRSRRRTNLRKLHQPCRSVTSPSFVTKGLGHPPSLAVPSNTTILRRDKLQHVLMYLQTPLMPLVSMTTGLVHPSFPRSVLQHCLLTHEQLDSLAIWYHQTHDGGKERWLYPVPITKAWTFRNIPDEVNQEEIKYLQVGIDLATKQRRFGRFIGLRERNNDDNNKIQIDYRLIELLLDMQLSLRYQLHNNNDHADLESGQIYDDGDDDNVRDKDRSSLTERMDKEWQKALKRAEDEKRMQEKLWKDF